MAAANTVSPWFWLLAQRRRRAERRALPHRLRRPRARRRLLPAEPNATSGCGHRLLRHVRRRHLWSRRGNLTVRYANTCQHPALLEAVNGIAHHRGDVPVNFAEVDRPLAMMQAPAAELNNFRDWQPQLRPASMMFPAPRTRKRWMALVAVTIRAGPAAHYWHVFVRPGRRGGGWRPLRTGTNAP